jgi:hypothetical protein
MKKALRCLGLVVMVGFLVLASTPLGFSTTAIAAPSCEELVGTPCSPNGAKTICIWNNGRSGRALCVDGTWFVG